MFKTIYSYPTSFGQVPVLVIIALKCSLLNNFIVTSLEGPAYSGVSNKYFLKTIKILLLMVQCYNAPPNFAKLASGRQALAIGAHHLF